MRITDKIAGIMGGVLIAFALIYYSIQNLWETINTISFILGILLTGYFLYSYYKHREKKISMRSLQYGSNVALQVVIVIAIIGLLAFISTRQHVRSDWTENKLYSLADQTEKVLEGLDKDVKITAFYKSNEQRGAQDLLDEYGFRTDKVRFEFVDPDEQPQIARQYQIKQYNTLIVESGIKKETITELSEVNLTNAVMKVTREQDKVVYFLTGHGERALAEEGPEGYKQASDAIKNENHIVRELNLVRNIAQGTGVPDSCSVLVIASPKTNFFPTELDTIKKYIDAGGKTMILLDPEHQQDIADFVADFHVEVGNDMVVDASGMGQLFGAGPGMPLVTNYDENIPITKEFNVMTFYPLTCSVTPMKETGGYNIRTLLKTSQNSWAESDFGKREVSFDPAADKEGPVSIAVLVEKTVGDKKIGLVVFGDSDFAKNGYWRNQGNADIFLNTINYLAEEEDLITIRPKEYDDRRVTLTQADVKVIFYLVVIAVPLIVIIAGVVFYIKRGK